MVAGGKGVIRSMMCESEFTAELIPVDLAISGLIGIAHANGTMKTKFVALICWKYHDLMAQILDQVKFLFTI